MIYNKNYMKIEATVVPRQTKYYETVLEALRALKHATNLELLQGVQKIYPEVSATTIHRVSARLKDRNVIGCAPKTANGAERYDVNPVLHHHFVCSSCSRVCDVPETTEARAVIRQLKSISRECALAGTLTMEGVCNRCIKV